MAMDKFWFNEEVCRVYVEEQEKIPMVGSKDRELMLKSLSCYLPDEDKVHVGLGIGGGLDFKLTSDIPRVVRRIGIDYSPNMLKLCKERHPDAELLKDDLGSLRKLKKVLKEEDRPIYFTLFTNTLGNFVPEDSRRKVVKSIRNVMKGRDLLVAELYKRYELLVIDPGLLPKRHLKTRVGIIDLEKREIIGTRPFLKLELMNDYMKDPRLVWMLHSMAQQEDYGDLKVVQKAVGKMGHSAYWPETGDLVIYRAREPAQGESRVYGVALIPGEREEFEKYFEPMITSHRWEGMEMGKIFVGAGLWGEFINGETSFIPFFIPHYKGKENLGEFYNRYNGLFKKPE
jgi:hypothetical protein